MRVHIHPTKTDLGHAAATQGAEAISRAISQKGRAVVIVATGASQFETLDALTASDVDFSNVTAFHLDEYVGIDDDHPASFRRYLRERVLDKVPAIGEFVMVEGDAADLDAEIARLNARLAGETVDVCFAGIGENCHLAFNDPPADFETESPYIVVDLDDACRRQQQGEGWFARFEDVPERAVSMSIRQIMKSREIILSVSDRRKADAVKAAVEGEISPLAPASIMQDHPAVTLHLDEPAASLLTQSMRRSG